MIMKNSCEVKFDTQCIQGILGQLNEVEALTVTLLSCRMLPVLFDVICLSRGSNTGKLQPLNPCEKKAIKLTYLYNITDEIK